MRNYERGLTMEGVIKTLAELKEKAGCVVKLPEAIVVNYFELSGSLKKEIEISRSLEVLAQASAHARWKEKTESSVYAEPAEWLEGVIRERAKGKKDWGTVADNTLIDSSFHEEASKKAGRTNGTGKKAGRTAKQPATTAAAQTNA